MPHAVSLGIQIMLVIAVAGDRDGDMLHHIQPVAGKSLNFQGIIGEEPQVAHTEVAQNLGAHAVVAQVGGEAEFDVGIHGVVALFLELVGMQLGREPDTTALLPEVEDDTTLLRHAAHGGMQLAAAVAAAAGKDIAGEAFAMHAAENGLLRVDFTAHQGQVGLAVYLGVVRVAVEIAEISGQFHHFLADDEFLRVLAVLDNLCQGAGFQPVFFLEGAHFAQAGHGAVVLHDFAAHAHWFHAGNAQEVHRAFGVAGAADDAALHRAQREAVSGLHKVIQRAAGVGQFDGGDGALESTDAGGDTLLGIHAHGEGGVVLFGVVLGLHGQPQGIYTLVSHGYADEPAGMRGDEVDILRRGKLPGADEVHFILTVGVICHEDELAHAQVLNHLLQGGVDDGVCAIRHGHGAGGQFLLFRLGCGRGGELLAHGGGITAIDEIVDIESAVGGGEFDVLHEGVLTCSSWPRSRADPRSG